jgi:hypothetical protein
MEKVTEDIDAEDEELREAREEAHKANGKGGDKEKQRKQADLLIDLAVNEAELFHAPDKECFASIQVGEHRETWKIRSKGFRRWLLQRFHKDTGTAPNGEAIQTAINSIEAKADYQGPEISVHIRAAEAHGKYYIDLCDPEWRAIEIDENGWRIVSEPVVRFRRPAGMRPLPDPVRGGSVEDLRPFLNIVHEHDFILVVAWLLAAMRPRGPYPVLAVAGEQGSAKSTMSVLLRSLIDPNVAPLRALPREDRDLFISANNGYVLCFDNVSGLPSWISDTLCRLATGGGFSSRKLYENDEEQLFEAQRPLVLNGIEDIVARPDLADRSIFVTLAPIPEDRRRAEAEIFSEFAAAAPKILGALLDVTVYGINEIHAVQLDRLPRMADFAKWGAACEGALGDNGCFTAAYDRNLAGAVDTVIESDLVADAIIEFMADRTSWEGKPSDLLGALNSQVGDRISNQKEWPKQPNRLSGKLTRMATPLRKRGIDITREREAGGNRKRIIKILRRDDYAH